MNQIVINRINSSHTTTLNGTETTVFSVVLYADINDQSSIGEAKTLDGAIKSSFVQLLSYFDLKDLPRIGDCRVASSSHFGGVWFKVEVACDGKIFVGQADSLPFAIARSLAACYSDVLGWDIGFPKPEDSGLKQEEL